MIRKTVAVFTALFIMTISAFPGYIENNVMYDGKIIRLHVIANSDSTFDQELKLKVRDAVLSVSNDVINAKNQTDAGNIIFDSIPEMQRRAKKVIAENGASYDVRVVTGAFDFPAKSYQNITLPKGRYNAVRVIIGEGSGQNWWCVMFPPLCFTDKTTAYMPDADSVINTDGKIKFKLKLLEILAN